MTKKIYVWAAEYIVWNYQNSGSQGDFRRTATYKAYVALFNEFGKYFNPEMFDDHIEDALKKTITYEDIDRL